MSKPQPDAHRHPPQPPSARVGEMLASIAALSEDEQTELLRHLMEPLLPSLGESVPIRNTHGIVLAFLIHPSRLPVRPWTEEEQAILDQYKDMTIEEEWERATPAEEIIEELQAKLAAIDRSSEQSAATS